MGQKKVVEIKVVSNHGSERQIGTLFASEELMKIFDGDGVSYTTIITRNVKPPFDITKISYEPLKEKKRDVWWEWAEPRPAQPAVTFVLDGSIFTIKQFNYDPDLDKCFFYFDNIRELRRFSTTAKTAFGKPILEVKRYVGSIYSGSNKYVLVSKSLHNEREHELQYEAYPIK